MFLLVYVAFSDAQKSTQILHKGIFRGEGGGEVFEVSGTHFFLMPIRVLDNFLFCSYSISD